MKVKTLEIHWHGDGKLLAPIYSVHIQQVPDDPCCYRLATAGQDNRVRVCSSVLEISDFSLTLHV